MAMDDGTNQERPWDEARRALGRVAELFDENPDFDLDDLYRVEDYEAIPEEVRRTIEALDADERRFVNRIFTTLARNHFYLEGRLGPLTGY
ncbi:hypothetical protein GCM10027261_23730 [Geodermatophilus arenarius]|uniref:Uncharacterized protein n=1 Tax=Geodermatophilus arenarius TaxID=1137990 RepID=A0ABV9LLN8_9ACTN